MHMKHNIKHILSLTAGVAALALVATVCISHPTFANATSDEILRGAGSTGQQNSGNLQSQIKIVTNILLFLIGVIAVIAIIIGGIRYTTSNGDASQTKAAKDTILYAVVGLIVAIMAYAIVTWVVNTFVRT